ncbi:MAG: flagellar protein export ATPase FliI [Acetobacteraceae bacterium]|nr:flagellar protein export ATPase FliI [Acetobacteraceae bacterium]
MRRLSVPERFAACSAAFSELTRIRVEGRVAGTSGLTVDIDGLAGQLAVRDLVYLSPRAGLPVPAEVVAFRGGTAQAMPFNEVAGLGPGAAVVMGRRQTQALPVSEGWLGRVVDPLGIPLDGRGPLPAGPVWREVNGAAPVATGRARLGPAIDLGVRSLNCFATCRQGQRLGLFAGSGVGKSTLLAMMARETDADVVVLGLVGERGREVREFLEDDLGERGLARSVVVVATSDSSPLRRRQAAPAAMTIAEHFRDAGKSVLLLVDSITRFCLALREIGLSAGEPPATRGYPPTVFTALPRLLERAGPGLQRPDGSAGYITALFTVLVEGDDMNEPVADAVRGTLDGHVVLDRSIAERGRFPAVDVLRSLSRAAGGCLDDDAAALVRRARGILSLHADMADLVRLGAYRAGGDPAVDDALAIAPRIEAMLQQDRSERSSLAESFALLRNAMEAA